MSLTTGMAESNFLLLLVLWRTVWSLWSAVTVLVPISVPAIMRWIAFSSRRTVLIIAILAFGWWWRPTWGASPLAILVLATVLLMLVVLEDWFPTLSAKFYDTLADLFDVGDDLVIHPVDHIVLEVSLKANLAPLSERFGALKPLCPLLDGATKLF